MKISAWVAVAVVLPKPTPPGGAEGLLHTRCLSLRRSERVLHALPPATLAVTRAGQAPRRAAGPQTSASAACCTYRLGCKLGRTPAERPERRAMHTAVCVCVGGGRETKGQVQIAGRKAAAVASDRKAAAASVTSHLQASPGHKSGHALKHTCCAPLCCAVCCCSMSQCCCWICCRWGTLTQNKRCVWHPLTH